VQRSHHLLRQVAAHHELHLLALNQRVQLPTDEALAGAVEALRGWCASVQAFANPSDRSRLNRALTAARAYFRSDPYDVVWLESRALRRAVGRLRQERWDLIHVDTLGLVPYAWRIAGAAVVLNHHNVESHMMRRRAAREPGLLRRHYFARQGVRLARMERAECPRVRVNLVVSDLDAERLRSVAGRVATCVVPNGVDAEFFRPAPADAQEIGRLVFAGGMDWYPNREAVRFLVQEIWPRVSNRCTGRRLTILGRDPPPELVQLARRDARVAAPGFVEDVRPYLQGSSAYVCPIRDGGGTRLKILDALASGLPVVATELAVEGLGLVAGEHYVRAETAGDFVAGIERLEKEPELGRRLAAAGRLFVETRYSWERIGRQLLAAYDEAAAARRRT
jgi:glycosyltransferase involved in cell wall biosynthesis